jgi:hypothetical protein
MIQLKQELATLRRLFEPWNTAPSGTAIWEPEPSDPNALFKRNLIDYAYKVIAAGDSTLSGENFNAPQFDEALFDKIQESLSNDHEHQAFLELAQALNSVVSTLNKLKSSNP